MSNSKTYSIRLDSAFIDEYVQACESLPIMFKNQALIKSYMQSIIDLSNNMKLGELSSFGIVHSLNGGLVLVDLNNKVSKILIEEILLDVKE